MTSHCPEKGTITRETFDAMLEALETAERFLAQLERERCVDCGAGHLPVDHDYRVGQIRAAIAKSNGEAK